MNIENKEFETAQAIELPIETVTSPLEVASEVNNNGQPNETQIIDNQIVKPAKPKKEKAKKTAQAIELPIETVTSPLEVASEVNNNGQPNETQIIDNQIVKPAKPKKEKAKKTAQAIELPIETVTSPLEVASEVNNNGQPNETQIIDNQIVTSNKDLVSQDFYEPFSKTDLINEILDTDVKRKELDTYGEVKPIETAQVIDNQIVEKDKVIEKSKQSKNDFDIATIALQRVFKNCELRNSEICQKTGMIKNEVSNVLAANRSIGLKRAINISIKLNKLKYFLKEYQILLGEYIESVTPKQPAKNQKQPTLF
jgi:hypothetical protein